MGAVVVDCYHDRALFQIWTHTQTYTHTYTLIQETSIEPQLNSVAQWQYILPSEKCIIVFIMLLRVTMGFLKREKKEKVCRGIQRLQRCRFFFFVFFCLNIQWPQKGGVVRGSQWEIHRPCALLFWPHFYFSFNDTCHWTDQKTRLFWPKKKRVK